MERPISRRNTVRYRNKPIRVAKTLGAKSYIVKKSLRQYAYDTLIHKKSLQIAVGRLSKQNLSPLQRLKKFKKLKDKQAKLQTNPRKSSVKRVTFADEMTSEAVALNGSHEANLDNDEKILKPRKSILSNGQDESVLKNGSNENGSISENGDGEDVENGFEVEIQNGETAKPIKRALRQKNVQEKREGTPNRQSLLREAKTVKESTPKPETPTKRELRQKEATPRRSTPKPETPSKHEFKLRGTPSKVNSPENTEENVPKLNDVEENGSEKKSANTVENNKDISFKAEKSVIIIEESDNSVISIAESGEESDIKEKPQHKSFFSVFHRDKRSSLEMKDACEASSSSVICLDSPSISEVKIVPSRDIKGRKPINSFSKFPGRNVSISSIDKSLKRKAEESFEDEDRKRFAGETASGSEKSPGWSFFSPSLRVWSPPQATKTYLPTSTPFHKREEQDSMAVNYDSKTKLDLDESMESDTLSSKQKASNKWCAIM